MWWHVIRNHRIRQDINRHRMVSICDCGETWVCIGQGGTNYVR